MSGQESSTTAPSQSSSKTRDRKRLIAALVLDLAIAVAASAKDANFLSNFAFFWLPHPPLLMILWWFKPRTHALIGNICGLAITTALFGALGIFKPDLAGNAFWSWYLSALPGASVGGIIGYIVIPRRKQQPSKKIITMTCVATVIGAMITLALGLTLLKTDVFQKNDDKQPAPRRKRQPANDDNAGVGTVDFRLGIIEYRQQKAIDHGQLTS